MTVQLVPSGTVRIEVTDTDQENALHRGHWRVWGGRWIARFYAAGKMTATDCDISRLSEKIC